MKRSQPANKERTNAPGPSASQQKRLKSKPLCDCKHCTSDDCPDLLETLNNIPIIHDINDFDPKAKKGKVKKSAKQPDTRLPSIMNVMNQERDCNCEIMARAMRSNVHMNLGLTHRRPAPRTNKSSNKQNID